MVLYQETRYRSTHISLMTLVIHCSVAHQISREKKTDSFTHLGQSSAKGCAYE
jgi:hypothetical protein